MKVCRHDIGGKVKTLGKGKFRENFQSKAFKLKYHINLEGKASFKKIVRYSTYLRALQEQVVKTLISCGNTKKKSINRFFRLKKQHISTS